MFPNKRKYRRVMFLVAVTLEVDGDIIRGSECRNISRGGMCIVADIVIEVGKMGIVSLTEKCGNNLRSFKAEFRVSWNKMLDSSMNENQIGIEFTHLDSHNEQELNGILTFASQC